MPIAIQRISVRDLGPLRSLDYQLGQFNVIYGRNEMGKTSLVEFLLRSLFRSSQTWKLRNYSGSGQLYLTGLTKEPTVFSPDSDRKLEDFWEDELRGYPPDLAKLLVVKGAELDMARGIEGGIDRTIIRQFLSQTAILDSILGAIPSTIQTAVPADRFIDGQNRGKIKDQRARKKALDDLDDLIENVTEDYSSGRLAGYQRHERELFASIEEQIQARQYYAHQLYLKRAHVLEELEALPADQLKALDDLLRDFKRLNDEQDELREKTAQLGHAAEDYRWLSTALETLDEKTMQGKRPSSLLLGASGLLLAAGAALSWFNQPLYAAGAIVLGAGLGGWYVSRWMRWDKARPHVEVREEIQDAYQQRFETDKFDYASMRNKMEDLKADAIRHKDNLDRLAEQRANNRELKSGIADVFQQLDSSETPVQQWEQRFQELRRQRSELDQLQQELEKKWIGLQVAEDEMLETPPAVEYDASKLAALEEELRVIADKLSEENKSQEVLRGRIRQATGAPMDDDWEDLLHGLQQSRQETADSYRQATAEILGQILVSNVVDEMMAEEDSVIKEQLAKPEITEPLFAITNRYQSVKLEDDRLFIADPYQSFPLSDLSTGTQEQVLLALRMAFAAQLMRKERMFLVLDDAFQYADWARRENLVDLVVELGNQGWQILYLTMDDHLRKLLNQRGKKAFGTKFKDFELGET